MGGKALFAQCGLCARHCAGPFLRSHMLLIPSRLIIAFSAQMQRLGSEKLSYFHFLLLGSKTPIKGNLEKKGLIV